MNLEFSRSPIVIPGMFLIRLLVLCAAWQSFRVWSPRLQRVNHRSDFLAATRGALRHRRAVTVKAMARSTWRSTSASESCLANFCEGVMIVPTESRVCSGAVNSRSLFCSIQHSYMGSLRQNMAIYALASQFMNLTNAAVFGLLPPKQFPKPQHSVLNVHHRLGIDYA